MMLLRGRLAQLLGFFLCELTQSLGLQTSTRVTSERRRLHRIAGLVVKQRVVEDEPEQLEELVVSTGTTGPDSSEEAAGYLEERLAQRIRDAITAPS